LTYIDGQLGDPEDVCLSEQVEIADVERLILSKNQTIISALYKGTDTLGDENRVAVLNKALQLNKGFLRPKVLRA
jgi:hypothetical protein